jgi:competence ComEA-like helix-hairpin-helix protein
MFDLTKQEKIILIFLSLTFVTGLGISSYKKAQKKIELDIQPYRMVALEDADRFIAQQSVININSSKIDELTRLPGVGGKIAQRIVQYHTLHGPFKSKEELMQVKGIGKKKFAKIKDLIVLE